jgi:hypothetical protein
LAICSIGKCVGGLGNEIAQQHLKYTQLRLQAGRDLLSSLSGLNHFQDRLVMEFKREVQSGAALSVLVIRLTPADSVEDSNEVTVAYGDAAKAMMRSCAARTRVLLLGRVFGILLPDARVWTRANSQVVSPGPVTLWDNCHLYLRHQHL